MKNLCILGAVVLVAALFRLVGLDKRPLGFTWDEAALGYNAYSLLKTGRDEYGKVLPIIFKSFGDYKPGLYAYLTVPSVAILGLNEFATRLPSAVVGIILVISTYFLVNEILPKKYAIYSAGILAISPWAIHFSRGAWEANVALLLTVLGSLLFVKKRYWLALVFFGLTFWTYQGAKMFTPLILLSLQLIYPAPIKKLLKPIALFLVLLTPILLGLGSQSGRLKVFSVFSYTRASDTVAEILKQDNIQSFDPNYYLFHAEILDQIRGITQRYLNHFSPNYLFFTGDWTNLRHSTPYYGNLHIPEVVTLMLGFILLVKLKSPGGKLVAVWLLLGPLPSALSRDLVSAVRSLPMLIPLSVISGIGLSVVVNHKYAKYLFLPTLLFFVIYFWDLYYVHAPIFSAADWLYPYSPALAKVKSQMANYQRIVFTDAIGQPYIFTLFYLQIDPKSYQSQSQLRVNPQGDVGEVERLDRFEYRPIFWPSDRALSSTLFVGGEYELPKLDIVQTEGVNLDEVVNYPNGKTALKIVGLK